MASLFQGSPQTATSYAQSTTETPKWMQDAIYNQIQWAQNVGNRPYEAFELPTVAELSPLQQQAYSQIQQNAGAWRPELNFATSGLKELSTKGVAGGLQQQQAPYLRPELVTPNLSAGQTQFGRAAGIDIPGAAQPYLGQAQQATARSLAERALTTANPYLQEAAQTSASQVGEYMSPYQQNVLDVIAKQGARNLTENLLPGVSDAFTKAGQFGSSRMGEFGSRALRDTQEAILEKQSQAAQQGYAQSLAAAQADLARQGQLAGTAGSISGADLSRILQGGSQYGNLGQISGQLTAQQMQNLASLGQAQTAAGQAQQQLGLTSAQSAQNALAQDYARQLSALQSIADVARQGQAMGTADVAALESAGLAQQQQMQAQLNAARAQYEAGITYPQSQLDWLNAQIRGMAPAVPQTTTQTGSTTGASYSPSPLSQLAQGIYTFKGLTT